jgi:hypothetical protein
VLYVWITVTENKNKSASRWQTYDMTAIYSQFIHIITNSPTSMPDNENGIYSDPETVL